MRAMFLSDDGAPGRAGRWEMSVGRWCCNSPCKARHRLSASVESFEHEEQEEVRVGRTQAALIRFWRGNGIFCSNLCSFSLRMLLRLLGGNGYSCMPQVWCYLVSLNVCCDLSVTRAILTLADGQPLHSLRIQWCSQILPPVGSMVSAVGVSASGPLRAKKQRNRPTWGLQTRARSTRQSRACLLTSLIKLLSAPPPPPTVCAGITRQGLHVPLWVVHSSLLPPYLPPSLTQRRRCVGFIEATFRHSMGPGAVRWISPRWEREGVGSLLFRLWAGFIRKTRCEKRRE